LFFKKIRPSLVSDSHYCAVSPAIYYNRAVSSNLIFFLLFQTAFCALAQSGQAPLQNSNSSALDAEAGNYYYRNYTIKEYKQDFQNWGVVQDKDGVMLFANGNGVMTFDGKAW
jgi:hypothetical protein